jgi:alpha-glucoside transport system permease protein
MKKKKINPGKIILLLVLIFIAALWTIPTLGVLVTSFRDSKDIYSSGWWSVLPHKQMQKTDEFTIPADTDPDKPVTIEGITASFVQWREGILFEDGRQLRWYGNKRSRKIEVYEEKWVGFGANLTFNKFRNNNL